MSTSRSSSRPPLEQPGWLRFGVKPYLALADGAAFGVAMWATSPTHPIHLVLLVVNAAVFGAAGLYRSRLTLSLLADLPYILLAVLAGGMIKVALHGSYPGVDPPQSQVLHLLALLVAILVARRVAYSVVRIARRSRRVQHPVAIVGAGEVGCQIAEHFRNYPEYGMTPVGFVDSDPKVHPRDASIPLLGGHDQLGPIIREHAVRNVVVAFGARREADLVDVLRTCDRLDCEVFVVPRLFELHNSSRDTDEVRGLPLIRVRRAPFRSFSWRIKRYADILLACLALVALSPLLLICALAVRLEGGPGVIFRQRRVGLDGREFDVLKFRSLKPADPGESDTRWNVSNDHRLGPVGKLLRQTSLDELPQLWNILLGHMSVVGPRPERPHFVGEFSTRIPRYMARHRVPAGLTGWAQVHGLRGDTSIEERARYDNYYIENWSFWLDMRIILMTVGQVLRRAGG